LDARVVAEIRSAGFCCAGSFVAAPEGVAAEGIGLGAHSRRGLRRYALRAAITELFETID